MKSNNLIYLNRTSAVKYFNYDNDGTGRDNYISNDNGGLWRPYNKNTAKLNHFSINFSKSNAQYNYFYKSANKQWLLDITAMANPEIALYYIIVEGTVINLIP